ncbi:family 78 glycoside hydrolase catalytic domain [Lentzea sp. NPDC058450]|uniref:family 78 glycoside hydrolase catalytic domain n=1 Tax=Lentzea sp. NPDC058450 TaxID=3346505 RepID=UPI00365AF603
MISAALIAISTVIAVPAAAAPADFSGARWIWYPEGNPAVSAPAETRYFRRTFTQPAGQVGDARLTVTGDDTVDVWLNGEPLAASARTTDSWQRSVSVDLRSALVTGTNTLAVAVRNAGGPAGLVARARIVTNGTAADLATGTAWKAGRDAGEGWEKPGFADGAWPAAQDLGAYGVGPWDSRVTAPDPGEASPLSVTGTTTERRVSPLGVDARRPRFGWTLGSASPGQRQGSYQVLVSSTRALSDAGTGDVWDSGRVHDERSVDVVYGGPQLASLTGYHWRVRVWDAQGRPAAASAPSTFETGLYNVSEEWRGAFIGGPEGPNLGGATWIWYPEGSPTSGVPVMTRYFRKTFTLPSTPGSGTLAVTADDTATVWLNGAKIYSSPQVADSWKRAGVVDLSGRLRPGTNTIAMASANTTESPAGLVAKLTAGDVTVQTDGTWKASTQSPTGWEQPAFDDGAWPQARALVGVGGAPWGDQVVVPAPAPLLRKGFTVGKPVRSARLVTTALGLHETQLNGAKVGDDVLAPAWTDYNKRVQYKVHDVTGQIRQGANALGAWLGNGWYSGSLGIGGNRFYGTQPWYSAQLRLTYVDGTTETVATDGSWKYKASPIVADDLYHGEHYDARLASPGWDGAGFDDSTWSSARVKQGALPHLVAQVDAGTKVRQDIRPVALTQPKPGVWVFDLGQNFSGWNRLRVQGLAGTTITSRHAEVLNPDGTLYTTNLRAAQVTDQVTLAGTGQETFEPRFAVHGYRYVELTGFPGTPTLDTITGRAAWTDGEEIGTFDTSDAMLDKLQNAIVWGQRSNMLYVPTDCPQRDERLGWTGDIASFAATATHNMDVSAFLDKYTDDMVDAQRSDGAFTDVAPDVSNMGAGTAAWGDAGVIVPYTLWQRYGDLRVVEDNFAAMTRWVDYLRATADATLIRDRGGFGDWLNVNDDTPRNVISTAYFAWSARLVSRMAQAIGKSAEATSYGTLADQVSAAFTSRLVGADGTVSGNTQTGYALALAFGLVPQNRVPQLVDKLVARVRAANNHLTVGFVGVSHLLQVLADHGRADVAYQILTQPDYPGWGYMVGRGATTVWERWDGIRPDGSFQDPGMNSFNHYAMGSVGDFLYRTVGGLSSASPGFRSLLIAPTPGGGLTSAKSQHRTPYGEALSEWSTSGGRLTLRVVVPAGTSAVVRVPAGSAAAVTPPAGAVPLGYGSGVASFHVPSGEYVFATR